MTALNERGQRFQPDEIDSLGDGGYIGLQSPNTGAASTCVLLLKLSGVDAFKGSCDECVAKSVFSALHSSRNDLEARREQLTVNADRRLFDS